MLLVSTQRAKPSIERCHLSSADPATGRNGSTARTAEGCKLETTHAATTSAPPTKLRWSRFSPSSRRPKRLAHKGSVATITDASDLGVVETRRNSRRLWLASKLCVALLSKTQVRQRSQHAVRLRHLRETSRLAHSHEGGGGQASPQQACGNRAIVSTNWPRAERSG